MSCNLQVAINGFSRTERGLTTLHEYCVRHECSGGLSFNSLSYLGQNLTQWIVWIEQFSYELPLGEQYTSMLIDKVLNCQAQALTRSSSKISSHFLPSTDSAMTGT